MLKLTEAELDVLLFVMVWREEPGLRQALHELNYCGVQEFYDHLARILRVPEPEIRRAVRKDGTLATAGLVQVYKGVHRSVELEPLEGIYKALWKPAGGVEGILGTYSTKSPAPTLSLPDFAHHPHLRLLVGYMRQAVKRREPGTNVLLYGPPGTGKTELVRTLAEHVKARLFEVSTEDGDGEAIGGGRRLQGYLLSQRVLSQAPDSLLLFDEIEDAFPWPDFFPFGPMHHDNSLKGWTNRLLETNPVPAVWICNHLDGIDPAHVRRFDLVIEIPVPPLRAREKMLADRLGGLKVARDFLRSLAANVHLAPGHIDKAAKVAEYCQPRTPAATGKILKAVIGNVHKALNLKPTKGFGQPLDSSYSLAHVNADHDLDGLVTCCRRSPAVRLLLHGPPGSGKTAFVQYLGHVLGKPVLVKTGSDLLRPYVGQTEMEVAAMFRETKNQAAILFVDEVDGFFQSRGRAHQTWEVTLVNEFLGELERFSGTFVGATNLRDSLDLAVFRRFDFKVGFDYLKPDQVWLLFTAMVKNLKVPIHPSHAGQFKARLGRLHRLTPGDFAVMRRKSLMVENQPTTELLLTWLEHEVSSKPGLKKCLVGF